MTIVNQLTKSAAVNKGSTRCPEYPEIAVLTSSTVRSQIVCSARPKKSVGQVAENIKKYRKLAGISQDQLSKKADLAFHTIAKIEAGSTPNPTIETVAKIAKALEVSVDDLLNTSKACLPVRSRTAKAG